VADVLTEVREAGDYGIKVGEPEIDYAAVSARREKVVSILTGGVAGLFKKNKIDVIESEGTLAGAGRVVVGGTEITAKTIVLATGSVKRPIPGAKFGGRVIGTEEAWAFAELPGSLAVVGAGASGTEIASAYARLGSKVLLLEALDRVLPTEDADISKLVERGLKKQGMTVHTSTLVQAIESTETAVSFSYGDQSGEVDWLVIAAGRGPDIDALGLDAAGVTRDDRGLVAVDGALRTSVEGVYAIGDIVPGPALAHKASDEGIIAVEDAAGLTTHPIEYIDIPRATFCTPNVASFGLTEAQAREQGHDVVIGKLQYGAVGAGTVYGDRTGLVKIVGEKKYGEMLGGHIVGSKATELIQELVNARALEGGYPELARIVHGHPTLSEAVMEAARAADGWLIHG
jgi:dihydrolipoamide dehydrogenase